LTAFSRAIDTGLGVSGKGGGSDFRFDGRLGNSGGGLRGRPGGGGRSGGGFLLFDPDLPTLAGSSTCLAVVVCLFSLYLSFVFGIRLFSSLPKSDSPGKLDICFSSHFISVLISNEVETRFSYGGDRFLRLSKLSSFFILSALLLFFKDSVS
jgi:hypothetical protein